MNMTARDAFKTRDRDATTAYQNALLCRGRAGQVAFGLFRAQKRSSAAKGYRRGSHRANSYNGKQEALVYLDAVLNRWGDAMGIPWGWKEDPSQSFHNQVLYVHLRPHYQASFHTNKRASDRDFTGRWDGGNSERTVLWYCDAVMKHVEPREGLSSTDIMPFGKFVGKELRELEPYYCEWLANWEGLDAWFCLEDFISGSEDGSPIDESGLDAELDRILSRS